MGQPWIHLGSTLERPLSLSVAIAVAPPSLAEDGQFAREVEIFSDFAAVEADWRRLEAVCAISPYQTFAFGRAYMETIGAARGAEPLIALTRGPDGGPAALLPLSRSRFGLVHAAGFQGGRMANYQMGLFREPERWTRADVERLLKGAARAGGVDLFMFAQQPGEWRGRPNPMHTLGGDPSPSFAYSTRLGKDYAAWLAAHYSGGARKKRRSKTRKLQPLGAVALRRPETPADRRAAFDTLLAQKSARMAERELPNEFDDPAVVAFVARLDAERAVTGFEWRLGLVGERIVSVYGGLARDGRLSGLVFSHDISADIAPGSPGEWLMLALADEAIGLGFDELDLGVGEARYKTEVCEIVEPLFDTAYPVTAIGILGAAAYRLQRRLKRRIKQTPALFDAARALQRFIVRPPAR
jgi:CelD/BcsL family acetyltransferase involved in cellulose biosynthesis